MGQKSANKAKLLEQIKADIIQKNICSDLAQAATNLVMGDGNPDAEIVFIGEAPGKKEDLQATPFVGAAGKFLNEMLASVGMDRSDVYITNIVKYRPPNNRDPSPGEKKAFWPFLVKELGVIRPKIVATLGRHSMEYFLPSARITAVHGQPKRIRIDFGGIGMPDGLGVEAMQEGEEKRANRTDRTKRESRTNPPQQSSTSSSSVTSSARKQDVASVIIMPLYHPAAALYNGSLRETLMDDFSQVPKIINLINEKRNKL